MTRAGGRSDLPVLILGAGPAGLSLALYLKDRGIQSRIIERDSTAGGLARSITVGPYTFDHSGHLLHTQNPIVLELVRRRLKIPLETIARKSVCYVEGRYIPFPYQKNLFYLPAKTVREALLEFQRRPQSAPKNFEQWLLANNGAGVCRQFLFPYNRKLWNTDLSQMAADWVPRFIPGGGSREMFNSAFRPSPEEWGYNVTFYYPRSGGIGRFGSTLARQVADRTSLNTWAERIDLPNRTAYLNDGTTVRYRRLVCTMPLPHFLRLCGRSVPNDVVSAGVTVFNLGLRRKPDLDYQWTYVPDPKIPFYRVGIYSNISPAAAPRGHAALYVECAARPDRLARFNLRLCLPHLKRMGLIRSARDIDVVNRLNLKHAYPVQTLTLAKTRARLERELAAHGVTLLGRGGAWVYVAMTDVIVQAHELAAEFSGRRG